MMRCRPGTVAVRDGPGSAVHRFAAARAAPHPGHVGPSVSRECRPSSNASHRREEIGACALLELAAGLGTETNRSDGGTMALRLQHLAAVGLGDQAAKRE